MEMKHIKLRQLAEDEFQQMNVMRQSLTAGSVPPECLFTGRHETSGGMRISAREECYLIGRDEQVLPSTMRRHALIHHIRTGERSQTKGQSGQYA